MPNCARAASGRSSPAAPPPHPPMPVFQVVMPSQSVTMVLVGDKLVLRRHSDDAHLRLSPLQRHELHRGLHALSRNRGVGREELGDGVCLVGTREGELHIQSPAFSVVLTGGTTAERARHCRQNLKALLELTARGYDGDDGAAGKPEYPFTLAAWSVRALIPTNKLITLSETACTLECGRSAATGAVKLTLTKLSNSLDMMLSRTQSAALGTILFCQLRQLELGTGTSKESFQAMAGAASVWLREYDQHRNGVEISLLFPEQGKVIECHVRVRLDRLDELSRWLKAPAR